MGVAVKQHRNSDGHKSTPRAITFSSLLHKLGKMQKM